mmetsp:Transcript_7585/g.11050  ORF Transcript_7585/g.11050 Transcript_7585/m.11050 type:complete len:402 (+) Transcript_7585:2-1207(+)
MVSTVVETPVFVGSISTQSWDAYFAELESFKEANGSCNVPPDFENKHLLAWISLQRRERKKQQDGLRSSLTEDRMWKLDGLGFDWVISASDARPAKKQRLVKEEKKSDKEEWDLRHAELSSYKADKGDCLVPEDWSENPDLGAWVVQQRFEHKKWKDNIKSSMNKARAEKLEEIGFDWKEEEIELKVAEIKKSSKAENEEKIDAPKPDPPESEVNVVDIDNKNDDDDSSSVTSVQSDASEDDIEWNVRVAELEVYKAAHGDCLVPENHKNRDLASFVEKQREEHKKWKEGLRSSMTKKKASKLTALKFEWVRPASASIVKGKLDPEQQWQMRWQELKQYKEVYGNCLVPKNFKANRALGAWVARQRTQYWRMKEKKPTTITKAQVRKLKQLQFAFIVPYSR